MKKEEKSNNRIIFITGGARSGKSSFAQHLASTMSDNVLFIATAEPLDDEMRDRIKNHRDSRPETWKTLEIHRDIAKELKSNQIKSEIAIIDCLTLLVSNLMPEGDTIGSIEQDIISEITEMVGVMRSLDTIFIIVSNEVGLGVVPENKLARDYRDILGKVNQVIAHDADDIYFMIAGIPQKIK